MAQRISEKIEYETEDEKNKIVAQVLPFRKLLSYADAWDWTMMVLGMLGSIVHGLAQPIGYLLLGKALDAFGNNVNDTEEMVKALKKVLPFVWYLAITMLPAGILETGCWIYTSERQVARLRLAFLRAALSQEVGAFDTELVTGEIINGISNNMCIIQDAIGEKLGHFLACISTFCSGVLVALIVCWEVSLLALLVVPLILVIGATYTRKMNAVSTLEMVYLTEATSMIEQTFSQIKTVFAYVGENAESKSFSECMGKQLELSKQEAMIKGVGTGMFQAASFCSWALIVWVGAVVVTAKRASGGYVIAAVMSILFGAISLTYAATDMQVFNQAKAAGADVFKVINRKPRIDSNSKGKTFNTINGKIDIVDVYFSYPSRPETLILDGFSLSIPAGKVVALVGSSGCGKSTIISLVTRFYDPTKGQILIDNHDIKDLDLKFLRRNIGLVSQEPSLFSGTIEDNIKVGDINANDQQIQNAAIKANAHSFISQLPDHYLTQVGERGTQLSGGQKQRIAIARAILKNPPILLLDETTSALDSEAEKLVQGALELAMQGRTVVLIAHRMSTIVNADMLVVVENGKVTTTGTHSQLLETNRFYSNLFSLQNISQIKDTRIADVPEEPTSIQQEVIRKHVQYSDFQKDLNQNRRDPPPKEEEETRRNTSIFFRIWSGMKIEEFMKIVIGSTAAAFAGIAKPLFGFYVITIGVAYYGSNSEHEVGTYSIVFSSIGLLTLFAHAVQHYFFGVIGERAMANLRETLYTAALRNELAWFEKPANTVGALTSRLIFETSTIKTIISDKMSVIVQCISSILIATTLSMRVCWRMGLVAWAVMPCHFINGIVQAKSAMGFSSDRAASHSQLVALASESVTSIKIIASFCQEEHILEKARLTLKEPMRRSRRESVKYGIIQGISLCLWNIAHAIALWYTTILVNKQQARFEDGVRAYQIFSVTVPSITELWTLIPAVFSAIGTLTPAYQTLDRKTEIVPDVPENSSAERITGDIKFDRVRFFYPLRPERPILDNFSLKIDAGSKVALVGLSGAGKSSILALLLRFYDVQQGKVLIDGKDIREYNLRKLRAQIAFVQQDPLLFSCSIRANISYGNETASEAEIIEVTRQANLHEFISSLPEGYDTLVGEKGCQLSGGQKQRIAIARALLKRSAIILLDEATSALDAESERAIVNALESANTNKVDGSVSRRTQVTVAHRLSTIVKSDFIVVMEKGKVVEMGDHLTLVAAEGIYSRLFRLQTITGN
ncbi:ATP-binding cassette [Lithospermum erythrorhizon]|uniref:ATP-binding cassette n=1 Tax=Lithospermum erythrorhizon TaxID=34254 RepID=A0AAV3PET7_LITER